MYSSGMGNAPWRWRRDAWPVRDIGALARAQGVRKSLKFAYSRVFTHNYACTENFFIFQARTGGKSQGQVCQGNGGREFLIYDFGLRTGTTAGHRWGTFDHKERRDRKD